MPDIIQQLDPWIPLEPSVYQGMQELANININSKMIELGCGDGRNLELAIALGVKPAGVWGVELNTALYNTCVGKGLHVINADLFSLNYSTYDLVVFWFTIGVEDILNKLYSEMKKNAKVVCLFSSRQQWRDGVYVPSESYPIPQLTSGWLPTTYVEVLGNRFYLYVR